MRATVFLFAEVCDRLKQTVTLKALYTSLDWLHSLLFFMLHSNYDYNSCTFVFTHCIHCVFELETLTLTKQRMYLSLHRFGYVHLGWVRHRDYGPAWPLRMCLCVPELCVQVGGEWELGDHGLSCLLGGECVCAGEEGVGVAGLVTLSWGGPSEDGERRV